MRITFEHLIIFIITTKPTFFQLVTTIRMCYAQTMLIDFHSHYPSPNAFVCTAEPVKEAPKACLLRFEGLLPDRWSEEKQKDLYEIILSDNSIHMGEIGLDKRFAEIIPIRRQADILREELSFAIDNSRLVSLHCVHSTGIMLEILSEFSYRPFSIIWHGFSGSSETAARLYKLGVVLSIGPRFKGSIKDIFKANPCTVPETDYEGTCEEEYQAILKAQYTRFSSELNCTAEEIINRQYGMLSEREAPHIVPSTGLLTITS